MSLKDREHLAYFITAIESDCDVAVAGQLSLLVSSLDDPKFNEVLANYREYENEVAERSENIIRRAIELWKIDCPEEFHFHWALSKSFRKGNYTTKAKEQIEQEESE